MKNKYLLLAALGIGMLGASCVRVPDSVVPDPSLNLDFTFQTRSEMTVDVSAINEIGTPAPGTLFSIYTENPYSGDEGVRTLKLPIYRGFTESDGNIKVSLEVPNNVSTLYVLPDYAGYGSVQEISRNSTGSSVILKGTQLTTKASTKAPIALAEGIERDRISCGNNFHFYTYFIPEMDYDSTTGALTVGSELVSSDPISNEMKDYVTSLFPEKGNNFDTDKCSDLIVEEGGTEIWLTFIGDGGYTAGRNSYYKNSIFYYTYTDVDALPRVENDTQRRVFFKSDECQPVYAFLNINPETTATGTKVQLLYWNGSKFVTEFPAGTKIGFALEVDGYRPSNNTTGFSLNPSSMVYSTPKLNYSNESLSIVIKSEVYDCYIMGMEFGFTEDRDFNDALVKITSSKDISITSEQQNVESETEISSIQEGTLAFEDLWPYIGDYDFNDFVTDYSYEFNKVKGTNNISSIKITYVPRAIGAGEENGFGIEFPVAAASVTADGASVEEGTANATVIVYNNTRSAFGGITGEINTSSKMGKIISDTSSFTVRFASPIPENQIPFSSLNPFLFKTGNRAKEIHLVDHAPTSKADISLFGTAYDKSYIPTGTYYRMDNKFPWALDIASDGITVWRYPSERINIADAYLHYSDWINDSSLSWFDWTVDGNANINNLY